ncbi:phospho-sugar glycosidase domain-containing protein [Anaerococcus sp. Marseille-P3625]|uniref:phospho-sugar glycosidase domain-containing protein n=1 Tax=Anaerococcus sp. Marseille-P3625 TaxID=1977277 RepID=UPI001C5E5EC6|nr:phospho-sugar glycosidase domain-containing protein [Anaerococcus sp. Marseille-P3625]
MDEIILAEDVDNYSKNCIVKFINDGIISLPIIWENDYDYLSKIKVRNDISDYIIRNEREKKDVSPDQPRQIKRGYLVILNNLSGRYAGEIEIVRKDLGICEDRNLIGRVDESYIGILDLIKGGDIVEFDRR